MKHICVYANRQKDIDFSVAGRIGSLLGGRNVRCTVKADGEGAIPEDADCVLVLGGDGTLLRAAREIDRSFHKAIPLLGINLGTLGYLAEVEPDGIEAAVDQLLNGDYELEERMMLSGCVFHGDGRKNEDRALNDIVISKSGGQQALRFDLYVNGRLLNKYFADGMIVTTPTGSTGYNLSAGGPVAEPGARLLVLTPICPHTMNQRSIILAPEDTVVIEIPSGRDGQRQNAVINFDGCGVEAVTGDHVRIVQSERTTRFIKLSKAGFLEVLRRKMSDNC